MLIALAIVPFSLDIDTSLSVASLMCLILLSSQVLLGTIVLVAPESTTKYLDVVLLPSETRFPILLASLVYLGMH